MALFCINVSSMLNNLCTSRDGGRRATRTAMSWHRLDSPRSAWWSAVMGSLPVRGPPSGPDRPSTGDAGATSAATAAGGGCSKAQVGGGERLAMVTLGWRRYA